MSRLQDVLIRGIRAEQPNATDVSPGTVYVVIDEDFRQEQSDGLVWSQFGPDVSPLSAQPYLDLVEGLAPPTPPLQIGRMFALDANGFTVIEVSDGNANVVRLASDNVLIAKVSQSGGIARGQVVYLKGASGANALIGLAKADSLGTLPGLGLALDPGGNNAFIRVLLGGTLQLLNTSGFAEGDRVFVSATVAGDLTNVLPVFPMFAQRIGIVTRSHATQGELLVVTTSIDGPPRHHAETHAAGGTDPLAVTALAGFPGGTADFLRADGTFQPPAGGGGGGGLIGMRVFSAPGAGVYTPTPGTTSIVIEMVGGGGGGSGVQQAAASQVNLGGAGGGGAYLRKRLTANFSGAAYVVGALGAGGAAGNNAGANGTASVFTATGGGTVYTAGPGLGGAPRTSFAPPISILADATQGAGGIATNGDVNVPGNFGGVGFASSIFIGWSGRGGNSGLSFGQGGQEVSIAQPNSIAGAAGSGFGSGGSGGYASAAGGGNKAGGAGTGGVVLIWEYS